MLLIAAYAICALIFGVLPSIASSPIGARIAHVPADANVESRVRIRTRQGRSDINFAD